MTNQAGPNRPSRPALRLLSLGAGVQSTAVLLLSCEGVIPRFDYAVLMANPQVLLDRVSEAGPLLAAEVGVSWARLVGVAN